MRRNMETTTRRDGYPAARVLDSGQRAADRLISTHPEPGGAVALDVINPQTGEIKAFSVPADSWRQIVRDSGNACALFSLSEAEQFFYNWFELSAADSSELVRSAVLYAAAERVLHGSRASVSWEPYTPDAEDIATSGDDTGGRWTIANLISARWHAVVASHKLVMPYSRVTAEWLAGEGRVIEAFLAMDADTL